MHIAIGSDHIGYPLKLEIIEYIKAMGHTIEDFGTDSTDRTDYPVYGERVGRAVASGKADRGVLMCGTGIGIAMAAGKVPGIRAATCSEAYSAKMTRLHNDANVIAFGARVVGSDVAKEIVNAFLRTEFEGGRHQARVDMIARIEEAR